MTSTSPARVRRAGWRSRLIAIAAAALTAISLSPAGAGAAAAATADDPVTFTMAPSGHGIVTEDQQIGMSLTVGNSGPAPLPAGQVTVEVGTAPLASRDALSAWSVTGRTEVGFKPAATTPIDPVGAQSADTTPLFLAPADLGLNPETPGVYPLRATYTVGATPLVAVSTLIVPSAGPTPAGVTVVVPITGPATTSGLLTGAELAEATAEDGMLREQLDAVTDTSAVLAVDPALVAAVRVLGSTAPEDATTWLEDLLALPNERFALQFGDADIASQIAAGTGEPLTVPTLSPYTVADAFAPVPSATPSIPPATPAPSSGDPALPTLAELTDIGATRDGVFWPATGTAGAETVAALAAVEGSVTLLPSSVTSTGAGAHLAAEGADVLAYDAVMSEGLRTAASAPSVTAREAALTEVTAHAAFTDPAAPLLLTVDRGADRSRESLRTTIAAATALPGRAPVGLSALLAAPAADTALTAVTPDAARVAAVTEMVEREPALARIATMLADPADLTASDRATTLQLLSNTWRETPELWQEAVAARLATTAGMLDGVAIIPESGITLAGSSADLVFTIRNDLAWPVTVELIARPSDARLIVQESTVVEIGARQTIRADVPVEARVGSGESSIDLQLRSPALIDIGAPQTIDVTVRAEWESVAVVVMSVLVTGLLVLGVVRTIRRRPRRRTEEVATDGRSR